MLMRSPRGVRPRRTTLQSRDWLSSFSQSCSKCPRRWGCSASAGKTPPPSAQRASATAAAQTAQSPTG
eukprot:6054685-Lingulodinium_polyedra.AAC.1